MSEENENTKAFKATVEFNLPEGTSKEAVHEFLMEHLGGFSYKDSGVTPKEKNTVEENIFHNDTLDVTVEEK